jgi:aryl-alcohol dehydrogenase-like predicted oxidoreductase
MADLPKRRLGRTGAEVTILGYGAMELRGGSRGPQLSEEQADHLLNAVLDSGINFIDTSIDYGLSEERIGKYISHRRNEYFLASKCGCVYGGQQGEHVHTAKNIREGVENSLRLMKTDHLDLVQFHRSLTMDEFQAEGALQEALKLKDDGKVRFVGVSGTLPNIVEQVNSDVFDAFQIPYSALQREHEDVIALAAAKDMGCIIRGGVARGAPSDWQNRSYYMIPSETMKDRWEEAKLDELLEDGMTRMEFMLRFTLSHPGLTTTIVGTSNPDHLTGNVEAAMKGPLPAELVTEAKHRLDDAGAIAEPIVAQ